ncbi:hypothetical protein QN277_007353 [Acacia crassicarpa]|uniref:Protein kinase domain-containing protein n=1 Tax=Acacia crassicarpa TaxID=499986 RepID=A0AAE1M9V7_9FABA|nr:hypothetical protein QN277_007353 [Acacia crassicarpa]
MAGAVSSEFYNKNCSSQCGNITNISYPFRLPQDPLHCGDPSYELACENNVTLLHVKNGTYRVVATYRVVGINYDKLRIKLVDPGIQAGNCSSLPLYSLSKYDFSYFWRRLYDYEERTYSTPNVWTISFTHTEVFKQVAYLNCSDPVREDTAYVDTAPCVKGGGHLYAVAGDLLASQFQPHCRLELVTLVASDWESLVPHGIKSYADIHTLLSFGFELSWWQRACADNNCSVPTDDCALSAKNRSADCIGIPRGPRLLRFAIDYITGILKGLLQIANNPVPFDPYDDSGPSKLLFKLGEFTGRFVLPYITFRFLFGVVLLSIMLIYTYRRRHLSIYEDIEDFIRLHHDLIPIRYSYKDLKTMTENFKNKLGEGGFATVFKGKLRSGPDIAIKMLRKSNKANNDQDFMSEVATIGRIHHFNVVHLVGFCVEGTKCALVYEFMSRGSLDKHIFF